MSRVRRGRGGRFMTYWIWIAYNAVITIAIRLRHDYDPTTTYRAHLLPFDAIRVVVVSQSNRTQVVISITSVVVECVMVSSYRSRIVVESQLWYRLKTQQSDRRSVHRKLLGMSSKTRIFWSWQILRFFDNDNSKKVSINKYIIDEIIKIPKAKLFDQGKLEECVPVAVGDYTRLQ